MGDGNRFDFSTSSASCLPRLAVAAVAASALCRSSTKPIINLVVPSFIHSFSPPSSCPSPLQIKVDFLPPKDYQEKEKEEESRKQALSKTTATKSDLEGEGGGEEKQGGSQQVWGSKKHEKGGATRASGSSKYFERLAEQGKSSGYSLGGGSSKRPLDVTRSSKKRRRDSGWGNS
uniref:Uncharacterized protein n=1 Tax=Bigelowiella natans TaxID=227086 RepID=A0A6U3CR11_BIGNA|mmetsp:Transcript_411/g.587  ORF Transcript_411/g.587 Transcript_411/m.587 type:complete len:175 (+) Transcript_411:712-1236(+)